jgi:hypothetical protein
VKLNNFRQRVLVLFGFVILLLTSASNIYAFQVDLGSDDWKMNLDTTLKYSTGMRMMGQNKDLITPSGTKGNTDDGDRNFDRGDLVSNRGDILVEWDASFQRKYGVRATGVAWYDFVYNSSNHNDSALTFNPSSVSHDEFTNGTRMQMGRNAELLEAFAYGSGKIGGMGWILRAGRFTELWGESLIFTNNGVAAGQAPLDYIKALGVPGTPAKELFMPVTQVTASFALADTLNVMAFYQLEWRRTRIPPSGSYFSAADMLDVGGEQMLLAGIAPPAAPAGTVLRRGADITPPNSGQYGVGTKYRMESLDTEFGLYFVQFDNKTPNLYIRPANGIFQLAYAQDIKIYALSVNKTVQGWNVGGEIGYRTNNPLTSNPLVVMSMAGDGKDDPRYAIGKTAHAQISAINMLKPTFLFDAMTVTAEVAGNRRLSISRNPAAFDTTRNRDFLGGQLLLEPTYYSVIPMLDLSVPISVSYNIGGKSSVDTSNSQAGSFSIGGTAKWQTVWKTTVKYTNYFGNPSRQSLTDRDYVSFVVQRTI